MKLIIILMVAMVLLTGCNNTSARFSERAETVTFTLENKKPNLLGNSEDHTDWMFVAEDGEKYVPYYGFVELDPLGRSELYRKLKEGQTYECVVHDVISYPPANFPVVKDCEPV
jgi:hypothetical protein